MFYELLVMFVWEFAEFVCGFVCRCKCSGGFWVYRAFWFGWYGGFVDLWYVRVACGICVKVVGLVLWFGEQGVAATVFGG